MPCCTYLGEFDYCVPTSDEEINSLLRSVCIATREDWRIAEMTYFKPRWFRRSIQCKKYELYSHVSGGEFQIINFYRPDRAESCLSSINHLNDAAHVAAYLYGVLAGVKSME